MTVCGGGVRPRTISVYVTDALAVSGKFLVHHIAELQKSIVHDKAMLGISSACQEMPLSKFTRSLS